MTLYEAGGSSLQEQTNVLFEDMRFRPQTQHMASLVKAGLSDALIIEAGQTRGVPQPQMTQTARDVAALLPYFDVISDRLDEQHRDDHLVFAGRDAEVLYDHFALRYSDHPATLLPASGNLFGHIYTQIRNGNAALVEAFFAAHGLGIEALRAQRHVLIDSGYEGSIARELDERMQELHGCGSLRASGALVLRMMCAAPKLGAGVEILTPDDLSPEALSGEAFPKASTFLGAKIERGKQEFSPLYPLATATQLLPHFTGHYHELIEHNGTVTAVSGDRRSPDHDVDRGYFKSANVSIMNPVAATIVQRTVIAAALER